MRETIVGQIEWISEESGRLNGYSDLWICLFMDKEFACYQSSDVELIKCMFVLSQKVLKYLLVPLLDMTIDEQLDLIRSDYPYDPTMPPSSNLMELEGRYFGGCVRHYRRMLFCITKNVFFHLEQDVISLFVHMEDDVNEMHFYAA